MAKLYALSEADKRKLDRMIAWFSAGGGGKSGRPVPTRRRRLAPGSAAAIGSTAMLVDDVPAATLDGAAYTATPGKGADDAAHIMRWAIDGNKKTIHPMVDLERAEEVDPDTPPPESPSTPPGSPSPPQLPGSPPASGFINVTRAPINYSKTEIRASAAEPILVSGFLEKRGDEEVFVITNVMDFRALPNFSKGTDPESDLQIPYHAGGDEDFKLDSEDCGE